VVVEGARKILNLLGVDERYLKLKWISASEGNIFAEEMRSFTRLLKELGPNPLARKEALAEPNTAA
jgi:coenzyme F420-reducing hydrogenase delta subunit